MDENDEMVKKIVDELLAAAPYVELPKLADDAHLIEVLWAEMQAWREVFPKGTVPLIESRRAATDSLMKKLKDSHIQADFKQAGKWASEQVRKYRAGEQ